MTLKSAGGRSPADAKHSYVQCGLLLIRHSNSLQKSTGRGGVGNIKPSPSNTREYEENYSPIRGREVSVDGDRVRL